MLKRPFSHLSEETDTVLESKSLENGLESPDTKKAKLEQEEDVSVTPITDTVKEYFLTRPIDFTGENIDEYITSCLVILTELSTILGQVHLFIPRSTWVTLWGLTLAPLYFDKPVKEDIILYIDVNNNEDIYTAFEINKRIKDGKKPKPVTWTTRDKGYQVATIRANNKEYFFWKHIAILFAALEIPYNVCLNRNKNHVDHKKGRTEEGVLSNSIENLQYLSLNVHAGKTAGDNPQKGKKSGTTRSMTVIQYSNYERTIEVARFPSAMEASRQTGIGQGGISRSCKNENWAAGKFWWKQGEQSQPLCKLGQEMLFRAKEWRTAVDHEDLHELDAEISDNLVVRYPTGRITIGIPTDDGKRRTVQINEKEYKTYQLTCAAWWGKRPSPKHHCAHLNDKYEHITYKDLAWQPASENIGDAVGKAVKVINKETGEIKEFKTITLAEKFANMKKGTLANGLMKAARKNKSYTPTADDKKKFEFCYA